MHKKLKGTISMDSIKEAVNTDIDIELAELSLSDNEINDENEEEESNKPIARIASILDNQAEEEEKKKKKKKKKMRALGA